jgi:beta-galactosidase
LVLVLIAALSAVIAEAQPFVPPASPRQTYNFNPGWKLYVGDPANAAAADFDDSAWKDVTLPHAWNEDSAFKVFIADLPTGIAWYRKHFVLPPGSDGKKVFLEFEGIRQGGEFYVNGQWIGRHENGVMAAGFDITTNALPYPQENVVAVRVDNSWSYVEVATGQTYEWNNNSFYANYGGINKNVRLHLTGRTYQTLPLFSNLGTVGTYLYAQNISISNRSAEVHANAQVRNEDTVPRTVRCEVAIVDTNGIALTNFTGGAVTIQPGQTNVLAASATVTNLNFWSWGYGYIYDVYTILEETNTVLDVVRTRTGFRKTQFTNGLVRLNDRPLQVKGYGQRTTDEWPAIGQSVPAWLSDFSQRLIVESGGNTVRWMHVTPSKQTVEACDRNGLMEAMPAGDAEADATGRSWEQRKELMRDAIIYHRNHPSIVFYESGNEAITEAHMAEMKAIRNQYDPFGGRAIGCREMMGSTNAEYGGEMLYVNKSATKPMWMMEYSRDEGLRKYWDDYSPPYHLDGAGSSINGTSPANAYNRNQDSHAVENAVRWFDDFEQRPGTGTRVNAGGVNIIFSDSNTHCRGTQNYRRSGEVDAMRIPKDNYFVHQVMWDGWVEPEHPHAHLIGHWNYTNGTVKNIYAASTAAAAELFLNGQSLGFGGQSSRFLYTWNNIAWTAGTLKVVGYDAAGVPVCEDERVTAGAPVALRLTPLTDPTGWKADGHDLALFEVEVVDNLGRRCPTNLDLVTFALSGPAEWRGGIGVRSDTVPDDNYILSTNLPLACGVNRVLVRSTTNAGTVTLTATALGLLPAATNLNTMPIMVTNGLCSWRPGEGLPLYLARGPTPAGPAYQVSRMAVAVTNITAGTGSSGSLTNTIDDNEATSWTSSSTLSQAWIQFTLARTTTLSQVVFKFTQTPRDDVYPLAIDINGTQVYSNTPPTTLGYVTLNLPPFAGNAVRIRRSTAGSFPITEIEFYEAVSTGGVPLPAAPGGLTAVPASASRVNLAWADNATNELGFKLERATDGVNFSQVAVPLANATNHEDNHLDASTAYFYRLHAFNAGGESDASNIASATTLPGPPTIPSGFTAMAGDSVAMLNWGAASGASGYWLKRSTTNGGPYGVIARLAATNYIDIGLVNGTTYYYVVAATNFLGQSADSTAVSVLPVAMTIYEAENATLSGAGVASNQSGYSGTGYADYQNASGDYVEWTINAPFSGTYGLAFRYALPSGSRPLELKVNGVVNVASLAFPVTGSWTTWAFITNSAGLYHGNNTVRLTAIGSSGGNIDYLHRLAGVPAPPPRFGNITLSDSGRLVFDGTGGVTNGSYYVLVSTNLSLPFAQWPCLATNNFDASGNFNFTNDINPGWPQAFYRLELQ